MTSKKNLLPSETIKCESLFNEVSSCHRRRRCRPSSNTKKKDENIFQMMRNDVKHQLCNLMVAIFKSFLFYFPHFFFGSNNHQGCLLSYDSRFDYLSSFSGWAITKEKRNHKKEFICVWVLSTAERGGRDAKRGMWVAAEEQKTRTHV